MPKVTLPDGCYGLEFADGRKRDGRGGTVDVTDDQARAIEKSWYRSAGVLRGGQQVCIGTKGGRRCLWCRRTWQAWSSSCPKCGRPTMPETA